MEHDEQVAFFTWCELAKKKFPQLEWIHAIPNGGKRTIGTAIKLKKEGVRSGIFDVFLPFPCGKYHGLYIEFKYDKNKLSVHQENFKFYCDRNFYKTVVCYSGEDAAKETIKYLNGY